MDRYQALANEIVTQAAKDYKAALRALKKNPKNEKAMEVAMDREGFFHSDWYTLLTDVDPDYLIDRLRKEVVN